MIVTAEANGRNQRQALVAAGLVAWAAGLLVWLFPPLWLLLGTESLYATGGCGDGVFGGWR